METLAVKQAVGQPVNNPVEATTTTEAVVDQANSSVPAEPPVKLSTLQKFLSVRGLATSDRPQRRITKATDTTKLTGETLSKTYTKRRHGAKTVAQRAALREPDDILSDSVDAYVPRKRQQELMNLHKDEQEINDVFLTETRALYFEREVLDKVVCDREENRDEYEERLWQLMVKDRGLQQVDDDQQDSDSNQHQQRQEEKQKPEEEAAKQQPSSNVAQM
ncbi:unnamed protein product [Phytophthora lilii]|uniref:Unnamed protein product n=1 Tax=Phytophthora lilii TaxID=2077276 RepID=A0A9W6U4N9_9STRA|nr:unnamed protein product [Phytophthora lilii]